MVDSEDPTKIIEFQINTDDTAYTYSYYWPAVYFLLAHLLRDCIQFSAKYQCTVR
jgi:hypothetical protein